MSFTLAAGLSSGALAQSKALEPLTEADFDKIHKVLSAGKEDPWETIPWMISVREARLAAAKQKKPILLWAHNGHPLGGC